MEQSRFRRPQSILVAPRYHNWDKFVGEPALASAVYCFCTHVQKQLLNVNACGQSNLNQDFLVGDTILPRGTKLLTGAVKVERAHSCKASLFCKLLQFQSTIKVMGCYSSGIQLQVTKIGRGSRNQVHFIFHTGLLIALLKGCVCVI